MNNSMITEQSHPDTYELPSARSILALALPALGVLIATPLFLLLDTAAVGRFGGGEFLAALATGTTLFSIVTTQLTFLSYGTTARSARYFGAGDRSSAIAEGVQATWVGIAVGIVLALIMWFGAPWFSLWISANSEVSELATTWLRITSFAIPMVLCSMAGNGWLRGIQNTKLPLIFTLLGLGPGAVLILVLVHRYGIVGSAWATLAAEAIMAGLFVGALVLMHKGSWAPDARIIKDQLILGRDLIVRSLAFQVAFLSAAAVAGRISAQALGAHQVLLQLWNFFSLLLDSLAIAAQTLVGAALGAQSLKAARQVGQRILLYSLGFSVLLAAVLAASYRMVPPLFTTDQSVLKEIAGPWWQLVFMIIVAGVVFALDGVLLGAADAAYLRTTTLIGVLGGFLPGVWIANYFGLGLQGVWWGILAFMMIRFFSVVGRFYSMKWASRALASNYATYTER
ncbi:MATE family efflux transporter [Corynebacterium sp. ES2794-CONJ1]|uniref:MATE family efflux transporter n=1 Tax=unclassified Corynebacterium TaxID=2624378 RepID=UPI0021679B13|nr:MULTISPECIES: MATE family efflux transporter [unclassified Corynebacterium]MCS4489126.1 MATE family efflux transporter [Corynebacterium sp. ES2775-CONJ]MCU9518547.1 MATE family efflux transporter [Corynebacterium sp. ES2794-CONJ1]